MSMPSNQNERASDSRAHILLHRKDAWFAAFLAAVVAIFGAASWLFLGKMGLVFAVALALGLFCLVCLEVYRRLQRQIMMLEHVSLQCEGLIALYSCIQPGYPLPPLRGYAASPDLLHLLMLTIFEEKPGTILECGSGSSTLSAAYCLKRVGKGKVFSLEHEKEFALSTQKRLERHALTEWAEVIHAPLREVAVGGKSRLWYDRAFLQRIQTVDLLLVDGPPGYLGEMMRCPALPVLHSWLGPRAVVIVDDADREDERKMVNAWLREFPDFECQWFETQKGTAILRRRHAKTTD